MGEPKGKLVTPVADNPDDEIRSLEVDALDNLKVAVQSVPTTVVIPHADEKLFGFESVIAKLKSGDAVYAAFNLDSDAVPDNKIWKITHITAWNQDGDIATRFGFKLYHDGNYVYIHRKEGSTARYESIDKHVELYLDVNDYIRAEFEGVASPETCKLNIFGYEMNVP